MKILRTYLLSLIFTLIFAGCSDDRHPTYGGTFSSAIYNSPSTFTARNINDLYSTKVVNQIMEGLVGLDPKTLQPTLKIARNVEISEDGLTYTFEIKEDVYFHPHKELQTNNKLSPEDVLATFKLICTRINNEKSLAYSTVFENNVVGAEEFYNKQSTELKGVQIDNNSIIIKLIKKDTKFLDKLSSVTTSILSKKLIEKGQDHALIGTGPFKYHDTQFINDKKAIVLTKNQDYHKADATGTRLPYLDTIIFYVIPDKNEQLSFFKDEKIDILEELPPHKITKILEERMSDFSSIPPKLLLKRKPLLGTQYYIFNLKKDIFKDKRIRQAINYAVDKEQIMHEILNDQAYGIGDAGLVPPNSFAGYDVEEIKKYGYTFQPQKARRLLSEAGFPNGKGFPTIDLKFNLSDIHTAVAENFANQMKSVLNINVTISGLTFKEQDRNLKTGNGDLFRTSWYADYYSVESFLQNGYGKTVPENDTSVSLVNSARFQNEEFDKHYEAGKNTSNTVDRYAHFLKAEKIMVEEAPFIILWYEESILLTHAYVKNLELNSLCYFDLSEVYLKPWTSEAYSKK
ncbi:MAG: peptide ABC transporter substrate-binding protein [Lishizhenia sp.]